MSLDRHLTTIAAAVGAVTFALLAWVNFAVDPGEDGGLAPFLVTGAVALGVWALVYGWYLPRAQRPAAAGLVAGLFGVVSLAAFWSGLPIVLGSAAAVLGARGRGASRRAGLGAIALGTAALALTVVAVVYDQLT